MRLIFAWLLLSHQYIYTVAYIICNYSVSSSGHKSCPVGASCSWSGKLNRVFLQLIIWCYTSYSNSSIHARVSLIDLQQAFVHASVESFYFSFPDWNPVFCSVKCYWYTIMQMATAQNTYNDNKRSISISSEMTRHGKHLAHVTHHSSVLQMTALLGCYSLNKGWRSLGNCR